jgi:hypothetical protein
MIFLVRAADEDEFAFAEQALSGDESFVPRPLDMDVRAQHLGSLPQEEPPEFESE